MRGRLGGTRPKQRNQQTPSGREALEKRQAGTYRNRHELETEVADGDIDRVQYGKGGHDQVFFGC